MMFSPPKSKAKGPLERSFLFVCFMLPPGYKFFFFLHFLQQKSAFMLKIVSLFFLTSLKVGVVGLKTYSFFNGLKIPFEIKAAMFRTTEAV